MRLFVENCMKRISSPSISFAQCTTRTLMVWISFPKSMTPFLNLILFLSNHSDHITHPRISSHSFPLCLLGTKFLHAIEKGAQRCWSTHDTPHQLRTSIHTLHEKLHVNSKWEFDSNTSSQKGHFPMEGSIKP